jgi:hypothetical protein
LRRATARETARDEVSGDGSGGAGVVGSACTGADGRRQGGHKGGGPAAAGNKPKVDEKAYQEALKRIPDSKEKYDPWAVTKSPEAGKSSKSAQ